MGEIHMAEMRGYSNISSSIVENQLKAAKLRPRKVEEKIVAVVNFGMYERCGNGLSGGLSTLERAMNTDTCD